MLPTDRRLRQMSCLGNGLSLSRLTEGLSERSASSVYITHQREKENHLKNHLITAHLKGGCLADITGLYFPDGMSEAALVNAM